MTFDNLISGFNIDTKKFEQSTVVEKKEAVPPRFLTIAPHGGFLIPEVAQPFVKLEDEEALQALYGDGDPYTDLFDFTAIGGTSINTRIHRAVGDANRTPDNSSQNGFIREISFDGFPLLKKHYTLDAIQVLQQYHQFYWAEIAKEVNNFQQKKPSQPLLMVQVHSMDPVTPSFYGTAGQARPDLCLVAGEPGQYMNDQIYAIVQQQLEKMCSEAGYTFALNNPFNGRGSNYTLLWEHGKPQPWDNI